MQYNYTGHVLLQLSTALFSLFARNGQEAKGSYDSNGFLKQLHEAAFMLTPTNLPTGAWVCTPPDRYAIQMTMWSCEGEREKEKHEGGITFGCFTSLIMLAFWNFQLLENKCAIYHKEKKEENKSI